MFLNRLTITNFKNISEADIEFSPAMNCLLGNNGMGKSNLLDAIYYLSFCKSFTSLPDSKVVRHGEQFMMLRGCYTRHGIDEELNAGYAVGRRKSFKRKGKEYQRLSDHIGSFPLVTATPHDIELINGTGEDRRRFIDQIIGQSDKVYLSSLIRYNSFLEQRNRMLRDHVADHNLFMAVETPMAIAAEYIAQARRRWTGQFSMLFDRYYKAVAGPQAEEVTLTYATTLEPGREPLTAQFDSARRHDEIVGHTSVGPHRDDLAMTIDTMPLRRIASQGQCKTFVIAMRLAQYDFLASATGLRPLLLLDDIFDKLDASRVERIVEITRGVNFGQIFITDTNRDHLDSIMTANGGDYRLWNVENGRFSLINHNPR